MKKAGLIIFGIVFATILSAVFVRAATFTAATEELDVEASRHDRFVQNVNIVSSAVPLEAVVRGPLDVNPVIHYSVTFDSSNNMHFSVMRANGDVYDAYWNEMGSPRYIGNYFGN